jgi:uncharacterized membrane-anchored protein
MKGTMSLLKMTASASLILACSSIFAQNDGRTTATEDNAISKVHWLSGPTNAALGSVAHITVPEGYRFADGNDVRRLRKASGEPTSGKEMGILISEDGLIVLFSYDDSGYVKDDDKDKLDADKLLDDFKRGTEAANEYRREHGASEVHVTGWEQPPKYNPETHNLEWAIRGESEGRAIVNYDTRLLGRPGVMSVKLVVKPDALAARLPDYQKLLTGYSFNTGQTYAEYKQGDKLAKYGLAALITAGGVVVAAKTGLLAALILILKKAWKLVVVAVAAVAAAIKNFFARLFGGGKKNSDSGNVPPA